MTHLQRQIEDDLFGDKDGSYASGLPGTQKAFKCPEGFQALGTVPHQVNGQIEEKV